MKNFLRLDVRSILSVPAYQSHRFRKYFVISSMPCFRHWSRYSRSSPSAASHPQPGDQVLLEFPPSATRIYAV